MNQIMNIIYNNIIINIFVRTSSGISLNIPAEAVEKNEMHILRPPHFLRESEGFGSNQAKRNLEVEGSAFNHGLII